MTEERPREFRYRDTRAFWIFYGLLWIVLGTVAAFGHNWWVVTSAVLGLFTVTMSLRRVSRPPTS